MSNSKHPTGIFICLLAIVVMAACHAPARVPDLGGLYNHFNVPG
jgi:hypothetical protein